MKFNNVHISKAIIGFKKNILKTYPFLESEHYLIDSPCIFLGIYNEEDYLKILNHKSYALIIWGGSDSLPNRGMIQKIAKLDKKKYFNISISKDIFNSLNLCNIKSSLVRWHFLDKSLFYPVKKGKCIYIYLPNKYEHKYGYKIYEKLRRKLIKYDFIVGDGNISYNNMHNIYSKCFIGLRLIKRDGSATTVQELGLMGIKCVHNGGSLSALPWRNIDDIVKHIDNESKKIGTIDNNLAKNVDNYLNLDENFFDVSTYFENI